MNCCKNCKMKKEFNNECCKNQLCNCHFCHSRKERLYIKDKVDGQQHCLSGDQSFFLIDVTDDYSKNIDCKIDCMLEWLKNTRRELINMLDVGVKSGFLTQKEREVFYFRHIDWNSLENCGKQFNVTRERIRQIEAKVLEKLRNYK